jgi:di/tricarboxylate transporter
MADYIGWLATATFASSYFSKHPARLRRIQALAALLWMSYGVLIHAVPIIVANLIVAVLAVFSSFRTAQGAVTESSAARVPLATDEG